MPNFSENLAKSINPEDRDALAEQRIKEQLGKTLKLIKIGDAQIEPWKLKSLRLKLPNAEIFQGPEITDLKEREKIISQAILTTQKILEACFDIANGKYHKDFAGLCAEGSSIVQELLAYSKVRSILIYGLYDVNKTDRIFWLQSEEGELPHYWLYASSTGAIPFSTDHARKDLLIVDPTRKQFHHQKRTITHPNEGKYTPYIIPKSKKSSFYIDNEWLWNEVELKQWIEIINSLYN